ncbi:helix-turn-helix domain-containing protein [Marinilactibacillus kalidii]|uniref:helix-turn-helix domain-containing protein n=1 Tax=Marinilactibacillus kalidii TaxID=2820274 RepID=UPI001ABE4E46|nr:helix-turn-helix transcriptional regulator [Marinilactibacillus kalidii]
MLQNFERIRKEKKVSLVDIADLLNVRYQTVREKINGESDFKFGEAVKVKNTFFPEFEIEYIFMRETDSCLEADKELEHSSTSSC